MLMLTGKEHKRAC